VNHDGWVKGKREQKEVIEFEFNRDREKQDSRICKEYWPQSEQQPL